MKKKYVRWLAIVAVVLAVAVIVAVWDSTPTSATTVEGKIEAKLKDLGAKDAQDQGLVPRDNQEGEEYRVFTSAAAKMEFYFDPVSGDLAVIHGISDTGEDGGKYTPQSLSDSHVLTEEERFEFAMDHAEKCVGDRLIGELEISEHSNEIAVYIYEYYNGVETGTAVSVFYDDMGTFVGSVIDIGTLFTRNSDGTYSYLGDEEFLPEQQAVDAAYECFQANMDGVATECYMDRATVSVSHGPNNIFYVVSIPFQDTCNLPCERFFKARVDVFTCEVLHWDYTK